ncbi:MAG: DUF1501 domain-containing protein [Pirellulales bacterium]
MPHSSHEQLTSVVNRRNFFGHMGRGFIAAGLASLWGDFSVQASPLGVASGTLPKPTHFAGRARACIQLFMTGGPSQVDLLDPKPALDKHAGDLPRELLKDVESVNAAGGLLPSPFRFSKCGQSGLEISELLPHLATCADELSVVRSMWTTDFNHESAIFMMHSGRNLKASPAIGSWVIYGLGSDNQDLPAYVALDDPDNAILLGKQNWQSGWLPPIYQGTRLRAKGTPLANLRPSFNSPPEVEQLSRAMLDQMSEEHRLAHFGQPELEARIASYELAARMQLTASDALDLSQEPAHILKLYGLADSVTESYGRRCLMARRLVERGVRFVQIYMNATPNNPWDHHENLKGGLESACRQTDQPIAALLQDLKQRGLLDSTLVTWGGEFGRHPLAQKADKPGRDHGAKGFSVWLAGGGIKRGIAHGATDEFGYRAIDKPVSVHDYHATILHCLGLDHSKLVFNHHGLDERLTGVEPAHVVTDILA